MAKALPVQVLVLLVVVAVAGATPPGIAKNPSHATCKIKKYKHCYNLVHVCPKFCPAGCTVECASCKPICVGDANNPPPTTPSTPENPPPTPSTPENPPPSSPTPTPSTPENPPPSSPTPTPSTPENPPPSPPTPTPSTPENPTPSSPTPTPSTPENPPSSPSTPSTPSSPSTPPSTPENPTPSPSTPSSPPENPTPSPSSPENPPPSTPSTPENPTPSPSSPENPPPSPATPSPSTPENPPSPTSSTPPSSPSPSTPSSPKTARCRNKNYPKCYNMEHVCPSACPGGCEVDCYTCKPVCSKSFLPINLLHIHQHTPGAVCQDPRFIGGDGITFYFHGKKDRNFCLVSDPNLHINAHFIGRTNPTMTRDFTWVQSIAILFHNHRLFIGAHKTATWHDSVDRLALSFDGEPISIPQSEGATWQSPIGGVTIARDAGTNSVAVEVEGKLKVAAKVVPITEQDSRVHNYGVNANEDCFAHLDLGFKFLSLSDEVSGVLGQTYRPNYVSRVNIGVKMPVMGGVREFETSDLFSADCSVARFVGSDGNSNNGIAMMEGFEIPGLSCASGVDGDGHGGVVCKR